MRKKGDDDMNAYTSLTVPTRFVEANGIRFAYRRWGNQGGVPFVFNQHFSGNGSWYQNHADFVFEANRFPAN
jgi:hypothetical protein